MFKGWFTNKYNNNNNNNNHDINRSAVASTVAVNAGSDKKEAMFNGSFTGRYNSDISCSAAAGTVAVNAGDVKLQASMTDSTFVSGPTFTDLSLSIEKPGSFVIDFNVPNKDFKFQFMDTVKIKEMPLNLTYTHLKGKNRTFLDGSLVINESNKVSANYAVDSGYCKLKYSYKHKGGTMIEPSYDFSNNSWDLAVSQRFLDDDVLRASYETSSNNLGFEWSRKGTYKVSASLNLKEGLKMPRLSAESTWNIDM